MPSNIERFNATVYKIGMVARDRMLAVDSARIYINLETPWVEIVYRPFGRYELSIGVVNPPKRFKYAKTLLRVLVKELKNSGLYSQRECEDLHFYVGETTFVSNVPIAANQRELELCGFRGGVY